MIGEAMRTVNVHQAKTHLSRLLEDVEGGEEIVIARAGRPVARLMPLLEQGEARQPGALRGRLWLAVDFDEPLPERASNPFRGFRL